MYKTYFFFSCCVSGAQLRKLTITALVKPMQANDIPLMPNCTVVNIRALVVNQKHLRNSKSEKKQYYTIIRSGTQIRLAEQCGSGVMFFPWAKRGFGESLWKIVEGIFAGSLIGFAPLWLEWKMENLECCWNRPITNRFERKCETAFVPLTLFLFLLDHFKWFFI